KRRRCKNTILTRLQFCINNYVSTSHKKILNTGDVVSLIHNQPAKREDRLIGLDIMYEDNHVIVINKSAGLLSLSTNKGKELTAHGELMIYVRDKNKQNRVYVVHRLDRDT